MPVDSRQVSKRAESQRASERPRGSKQPCAPDADFLKRTRELVRTTRRRLRIQGAMGAGARAAPWIFGGLLPPLVLAQLTFSWLFLPVLGLAALALLLVLLRSYVTGPSTAQAAWALDRRPDSFDGVTTTLELDRKLRAGHELDAYWLLALRRLRLTTPELDPSQAATLSWPRGATWAAVALSLFVALASVDWRAAVPRSVDATPRPRPEGPLFSEDELELHALEARKLEARMTTQAGQKAAREFNRAASELLSDRDRTEAFRRLLELEAELEADAARTEQLARALEARGKALSQAALSRQAGAALAAGAGQDAAQALRRLAERLADKHEKLSDRELDELRQSLEAAARARARQEQSDAAEASAEAGARERLEQRKRLLEEKRKSGAALAPQDKAELERTKRELSRLDRNKHEREQALSELDQQLAEAARELEKERQKAGDFREQAAEHLKEAADQVEQASAQKLSDEEKKQLLERLKQLKEQLRQRREQGGAAGEARQNFERRARGQERSGDGREKSESGPGEQGRPGGSVKIPVPGQASRPGARAGEGQGEETRSDMPVTEPGTKHDPNLTGDATTLRGDGQADVAAVAQDTGEGPTASETIQSAARAGFTRRGYETIYRDYEAVAEETMKRESIPPGYRQHIERYFQLIRPRAQKERP